MGMGIRGGILAGVSEHQSLVAGALFLVNPGAVDAHGNIRGLPVNGGDHRTRLPVKSHGGIAVADILDRLSNDLGHLHVGRGGDLPCNDRHAGGDEGLAGHSCFLILLQNTVQDVVGNLVRHFVRVTFRHRFGGKQEVFRSAICCSFYCHFALSFLYEMFTCFRASVRRPLSISLVFPTFTARARRTSPFTVSTSSRVTGSQRLT